MITLTRLPHRALALTLIGVILVLHAGIIPGEPVPDRGAALPHTWLPLAVRQVLWVVTGGAAVVLSWTRWQHIAAAAAVVMPLERALSYLWSSLMWLVPGVPDGDGTAWILAAQWGCLTALILLIARWTEVPKNA